MTVKRTAAFMTQEQQDRQLHVCKLWAETAVDEGMNGVETLNALAASMCALLLRGKPYISDDDATKIRQLVEGWIGIFQGTLTKPEDFIGH